MSDLRIRIGVVILCILVMADGAAAAPSITFDWDVAGLNLVQAANTAGYTLTFNLLADGDTLTLEEGETVEVPLQGFNWSVNANANGSVNAAIDRLLTLDSNSQTIDQDRSFNSTFSSLFGGWVKNGTFFLSPTLTYDFGNRGIVDATVLQTTVINGLGTTGTSGSGSAALGNALMIRFTAHDIVPEPGSVALLGCAAAVVGLRRRR